jgi:serine/threonine protein kinase
MLNDTLLGSGAFSEVRLAQNLQTQQYVAAKMTDLTKHRRYYNKEVKALTRIPHHPNIVPVVQYGEDGSTGYIFTEFLEGKSLGEYVEEKGQGRGIGEKESLEILLQLVNGMETVHNVNFSHNDLKPDNVLYNPDTKTAKIFDFGLSTEVGKDGSVSECCGSPLYMAPEVITQTKRHNPFLSDIWSLGLMFYFMLVGNLPWSDTETLPSLTRQILTKKISIPVGVSSATRELLAGMLQLSPRARWNLERIKSWIKKALELLKHQASKIQSQARRLKIVTLYAGL